MAYACIALIGAYVYILRIGGVPGGFEEESLLKLVRIARQTKCKTVLIERNFGNGAHANMLKPLFTREDWPVTLEEVWETGQKELRIIDTLEPLLTSHRLIISPEVIEMDFASIQQYPAEVRSTYRLLHQMALISRDRGCLRHDDRLDALASAIRYVVEKLDFDTQVLIEARRRKEHIQGINAWKDPVSRRNWMVEVCVTPLQSNKGRNKFGSMRRKSRF